MTEGGTSPVIGHKTRRINRRTILVDSMERLAWAEQRMMMDKPQIRDETGKFLPGHSGNPGGRPAGLATLIRETTNDGQELVDFMLSVFRGEHGEEPRLRADAATWLSDRGFGKPTVSAVDDGHTRRAANDVEPGGGIEPLMDRLTEMRRRMYPGYPDDLCACDRCRKDFGYEMPKHPRRG